MDYTVTIYSDRMYVQDLNIITIKQIETAILQFTKEVHSAYNRAFLYSFDSNQFVKKYGDKDSLYKLTQQHSRFNCYYINSVNQLAKGKIDSQKELYKMYKKDKETALKAVNKKIKEETERLEHYQKLLKNYDDFRHHKINKIKFGKLKHLAYKNEMFTVRDLKTFEVTNYKPFQFEYEYLRPKIKSIKNKISKLTYRKNNIETKLKNLETQKHMVFGGKRNLKNLTTDELLNKKYHSIQVSGRYDSKYGNWLVHTTPLDKDMFAINFELPNREVAHFKVHFPYRGKEFKKALESNMNQTVNTPISYGIIRKKDALNRIYYQIEVNFNIGSTLPRINTFIGDGCVGCDFNNGHLDWSEIDKHGNLKDCGTIYYQLNGTSKENELSLRNALNKLGTIVSNKKKVLVVENIDLKATKRKSTYQNKKLNKITHTIPYARYLEMVDYLGYKFEFLVIKVHPAYTSQIGKLKYQDKMKLPSHISASYVIARRGMKYRHNEHIPKEYKHFIQDIKEKHYWSKFNKIYKELEKQKKKKVTKKHKTKQQTVNNK